MATISKTRRLINPGRRKRNGLASSVKRKLSPLQKMFFGSKRQRAAIARKKSNSGSFRKLQKRFKKGYMSSQEPKYQYKKAKHIRRAAKRNVGSIITVWPKSNPGKRKRYVRHKANRGKKVVIINKGVTMATKRRRIKRVARRVVHRRRRNYGTKIGRSWSTYTKRGKKRNPGVRRYHHHRRSNPGLRRRHYQRNPGMLTGTAGRVLGVMGGVAVTKLLCDFLPASLATGVLGYVSTAAIAVLQGKLVGKFSKSPQLGNDMLVGGVAYLTAKVLNDFFPSIGRYTGISGMGMIGGSSFYTPQINQAGSMGRFMIPPAVSGYVAGAIPVQTAKGVGAMRRTGRLM